jgi:small conductance mechanosensitive channel
MTVNRIDYAMSPRWTDLWSGNFRQWFMTTGLQILLLLIGTLLAVRFITWITQRIIRRMDARFTEGGALVRSEASKHRQTMAALFSWILIGLLWVVIVLEIVNVLNLPTNPLAGPAAVLGAGLGFGARGVIEDMLAGFLVIAEKQYGFGDLVRLDLASTAVAEGTVEDVTLRVTRLRSSEGESYTVPNGKVVKTTNLSTDWARAVIDIPVSTTADLALVTQVLRQECETALDDELLGQLLLDVPSVMGVESIEVDAINLRMVARTLPGTQLQAGRQLRALVVRALARAGIVVAASDTPQVDAIGPTSETAGAADETAEPVRKP